MTGDRSPRLLIQAKESQGLLVNNQELGQSKEGSAGSAQRTWWLTGNLQKSVEFCYSDPKNLQAWAVVWRGWGRMGKVRSPLLKMLIFTWKHWGCMRSFSWRVMVFPSHDRTSAELAVWGNGSREGAGLPWSRPYLELQLIEQPPSCWATLADVTRHWNFHCGQSHDMWHPRRVWLRWLYAVGQVEPTTTGSRTKVMMTSASSCLWRLREGDWLRSGLGAEMWQALMQWMLGEWGCWRERGVSGGFWVLTLHYRGGNGTL